VTTPAEDKDLEDYLRRKSALSLGYKKIYIEAPPPELDRAIAARARRALRWIVPAVIAAAIAIGIVVSANFAVTKLMQASVMAERNAVKLRDEHRAQQERERLTQPVGVVIDAKNIAEQEAKAQAAVQKQKEKEGRDEWLAEIEALRRQGKNATADAELRRLNAAYPEYVKPQ
jgi:hypothetical protein